MPAGKISRVTKGKKYATVATVKRLIDKNTENNYALLHLNDYFDSCPNAWTEYSFCTINQGDGRGERTGNKIRIKSITIHGILANGSAASAADDPYNVFRIMLTLSKGATPMATNLLTIDSPCRRGMDSNLICHYGIALNKSRIWYCT